MDLTISQATDLSNAFLTNLGFDQTDASLITRNLIEAELAEKPTHGLVRLPVIKKNIESGKIKLDTNVETLSQTNNSLYLDAHYKTGFPVIYQSLDTAIPLAKQHGIFMVGIKDAAYASGFIGSYAQAAAKHDLIFISFNNSPGGLIPHGAAQELWGTNPLTVGIPTQDKPIILDMASSQITWGDLLVANQTDQPLPSGVALDEHGQPTTDATAALDGGLLPFAGHKGSGLGFIVELLGGALTGSRVGHAIPGSWGTSYILINPAIFRPLNEFKSATTTAIQDLKSLPKAHGVEEIYFPGEQSQNKQENNKYSDNISVVKTLFENIS